MHNRTGNPLPVKISHLKKLNVFSCIIIFNLFPRSSILEALEDFGTGYKKKKKYIYDENYLKVREI